MRCSKMNEGKKEKLEERSLNFLFFFKPWKANKKADTNVENLLVLCKSGCHIVVWHCDCCKSECVIVVWYCDL